MEIDVRDACGTLAEGSYLFWPKGESFFEGSNTFWSLLLILLNEYNEERRMCMYLSRFPLSLRSRLQWKPSKHPQHAREHPVSMSSKSPDDPSPGCRHVFPPFSPLRHQRALGGGSSTQPLLGRDHRGSTRAGLFRVQKDQRGPFGRALERGSSQPTRLSGENGGKTCRHPQYMNNCTWLSRIGPGNVYQASLQSGICGSETSLH